MENLIISKTECDLLKLKIGRLDFKNSFPVDPVIECIRSNNLDILRIKIENPERNIYSLLDQLPYKYYLLNISQIFERLPGEDLFPGESFEDVRFENFTEDLQSVMRPVVKQSFSTHDGSYYYNPQVAGIYTSLDELNSMTEYMVSQFHNGTSRWAKVVYFKDVPVGFVSYVLFDAIAKGDMFGVLPEYQRTGLGRKIGIHVLKELRTKTVRNTIQVQQSASLNLHYSLGLKPVSIVLNFHIVNL